MSWKRRQENTKRRIASIKLLSPSSEEIFEKKIFLSHYCTIICCNKVLLTSHSKTFTQMSSSMQFEPSFPAYLSKHFQVLWATRWIHVNVKIYSIFHKTMIWVKLQFRLESIIRLNASIHYFSFDASSFWEKSVFSFALFQYHRRESLWIKKRWSFSRNQWIPKSQEFKKFVVCLHYFFISMQKAEEERVKATNVVLWNPFFIHSCILRGNQFVVSLYLLLG